MNIKFIMKELGRKIYLTFDFLSDSSKRDCSVDVFTVDHVRNVGEDSWFPVNESIQNVLLEGRVVVLYTLTFSKRQGVVAVGEDDGEKLVFKVDKMAAMDVSDGYFMFAPKRRATYMSCGNTIKIIANSLIYSNTHNSASSAVSNRHMHVHAHSVTHTQTHTHTHTSLHP